MDQREPAAKSNDAPLATPAPARGEQPVPAYWHEQAVPRTAEQRAELLALRPPGWEWVLHASYLLAGQERLAPKWHDHRLELVTPRGSELTPEEAAEYLARALTELADRTAPLQPLLAPATLEAAWGKPGESGDAELIEHVAARFTDVCSGLLEWTAELRSTPVPPTFQPVYRTASHMPDKALEAITEFVDDFVAELDVLPQRLASGEKVAFDLTLKLEADEHLVATLERQQEEAIAALRTLERQHEEATAAPSEVRQTNPWPSVVVGAGAAWVTYKAVGALFDFLLKPIYLLLGVKDRK